MFSGNVEILNSFSSISNNNLVFFTKSNKLDQLFTEHDYTNLFSSTSYFNFSSIEIFNFDLLVSEIESLSNSKNDVDLLCQIFPNYEDIICELDI
jgi:hypothetical protein